MAPHHTHRNLQQQSRTGDWSENQAEDLDRHVSACPSGPHKILRVTIKTHSFIHSFQTNYRKSTVKNFFFSILPGIFFSPRRWHEIQTLKNRDFSMSTQTSSGNWRFNGVTPTGILLGRQLLLFFSMKENKRREKKLTNFYNVRVTCVRILSSGECLLLEQWNFLVSRPVLLSCLQMQNTAPCYAIFALGTQTRHNRKTETKSNSTVHLSVLPKKLGTGPADWNKQFRSNNTQLLGQL